MSLNLSLPTSSTITVAATPKGARRQLLTPIPSLPDEYLMVIDNSTLEMFTTCPFSAFLYLLGERESRAKNAALAYGGAIHKGLEAYHLGLDESAQDQAILHYFLANPVPSDEYRNPTNALQVMKHYREQCQLPGYELRILSDEHGPIIERAFEVPLFVLDVNAELHTGLNPSDKVFVKKIHVAWSGRIDLAVEALDLIEGWQPWVMDHKTSSILGDQTIQSFTLSSQTIGYHHTGIDLWPSIPFVGCMINFIFFKNPAKGAASLVSPGPRGGPPALQFHRFKFEYKQSRREWWLRNVMHIISDLIHCMHRGYFTSTTKNCFNKYGRCQYYECCTEETEQRKLEMARSEMYQQVTWNPVAD